MSSKSFMIISFLMNGLGILVIGLLSKILIGT
jgi:hypothetical protein